MPATTNYTQYSGKLSAAATPAGAACSPQHFTVRVSLRELVRLIEACRARITDHETMGYATSDREALTFRDLVTRLETHLANAVHSRAAP